MRFLLFSWLSLLCLSLLAQAPQKFGYQAILRDVDNALVANTKVSVRLQILQGEMDGKVVYTETHNAETNRNGLLSLQVGTGKTNQQLREIRWNEGPYFLRSAADPKGGNSYSIIGTTEIVSVPYAVHAGSADSVTGALHETDPLYAGSVAASITGADTLRWAATYNPSSDTARAIKYKIGDVAQGGVVFWVDESGMHGLVAALENVHATDEHNGAQWMPPYPHVLDNGRVVDFFDDIAFASANGIGAGEKNTLIILTVPKNAETPQTVTAAQLCYNYHVAINFEDQTTFTQNVYGDFYLPSVYELRLMQMHFELISTLSEENGGQALEPEAYWSSEQFENDDDERNSGAWAFYFRNDLRGEPSDASKDSYLWVRPIRKF